MSFESKTCIISGFLVILMSTLLALNNYKEYNSDDVIFYSFPYSTENGYCKYE